MKRKVLFVVLILLSLCPVSSDGQELLNLREESVWAFGADYVWALEKNDWKSRYGENFKIIGKTEKNGKVYFIMQFVRSSKETDGGGGGSYFHNEDEIYLFDVLSAHAEQIGIREDNGRFLVDKDEYMELLNDESYGGRVGNPEYVPYETTEGNELVLYDFTKREGDVYAYSQEGEPITVVSVESFTTDDNVSRALLKLSNGLILIEGIGCINSRGTLIYYLNPGTRNHQIGYLGWYGYVYSPADKNLLYYKNGREAAREIVAGISDVVRQNDNNVVIYDLQGRPLTHLPQKGVYIRDGRKVVVK